MPYESNKTKYHLLFTGFLSFILIGVIQAMYGPAFFSFQANFGINTDQLAFIVSMHFIGSFTAILASYKIFKFFGYKKSVIAAGILFVLGALGVAFSPNWALSLASALLVGLGSGVMDVSMNIFFLRAFANKAAPTLNLLHAMFGVGSILGPILIALFLFNISIAFIIVAVLGFVFVLMVFWLEPIPFKEVLLSGKSVILPIIGFLLLYFTFASVEVSLPSWEASYLVPYYSQAKAVYFTSLFWLGMTIGRFLAVPLSIYFKAAKILLISTILSFIATLIAHNMAIAAYAYIMVGFAIAPIFATALAWFNEVYPQYTERLSPMLFASANMGAVIAPPIVGYAVASAGSQIIAAIISIFAFFLMLITIVLFLRTYKL